MKKRSRPGNDSRTTLTTRLCIKNLPKNVSGSELQSYLRGCLPSLKITDARVLQNRRMAFVGVSTQTEAKDVVRLYNRAYFQTCRLTVEYAVAPKAANTSNDKDNDNIEDKQKFEVAQKSQEALDKRKQEFLSVMGAAESDSNAARKSWANDDGVAVDGEHRRGMPNMSKDDERQQVSDDEDSEGASSASSVEDAADPLGSMTTPSLADMDFLKSKTIAVDELEDTGENVSPLVAVEKEKKVDTEDDSSSSSSSSSSIASNHASGPAKELKTKRDDFSAKKSPEPHDSSRLFLRNLPFTATSDDLLKLFENYSPTDVHLPVDDQKNSKGFGFITLATATDAGRALKELDGSDFQGRLLHILFANRNPKEAQDELHGSMTFKERKDLQKRQEAMKNTTGWSASYLRGDAIIDALAERLGLRKSSVLNVKDGMSGGDAAVRLALGETALIEENRKYFAEHGVDMDALVSVHRLEDDESDGKIADQPILRSQRSILVKNLPADTTEAELFKVFGSTGEAPQRILLPPSRTIGLVEYNHPNDAKSAFKRLAFKRFKTVPIYLEWAPLKATDGPSLAVEASQQSNSLRTGAEDDGDIEPDGDDMVGPVSTLYVKNLNFSTTEERLKDFLSTYSEDLRAVRIPKKTAAKRRDASELATENPQHELSMGYGFLEFGSSQTSRRVLRDMQGAILDGHKLEFMPSKNVIARSSDNVKPVKKSSKLMIRNVPFQATRKELLQLFGSFGQLKKIRLPRKFAGGHRGFCFVEYLTSKEAAAAMTALSRTHFYGRHLVIEWASADEEAENLSMLRAKAERDLGVEPQRVNKKIRFS